MEYIVKLDCALAAVWEDGSKFVKFKFPNGRTYATYDIKYNKTDFSKDDDLIGLYFEDMHDAVVTFCEFLTKIHLVEMAEK
ncbi:MAG: hypothetical protein LUD47_07870 [Clostridia bacterium]|nr:hypothetical protein [Clostridia bacterium]